MDQCYDFVVRLEKDMSLKILQCLESPSDLVRVSAVSRSWRRFVLENELCKQFCMKLCPELSNILAVNLLSDREPDLGSITIDKCQVPKTSMETDHGVFSLLACGLTSFPEVNCINDAICVSSTDRFPDERVENTLEDDDDANLSDGDEPFYWSSKGERDASTPETLVYRLAANLCLISEIYVRPFQAYFEPGHPFYSAEAVRFSMGHLKSPVTEEMLDDPSNQNYDDDMFIWTYVSPEFPMAQANNAQRFQLPRPVLCMGGILKIELLGRVHKSYIDDLYYICVSYVKAVGRALGPKLDIDILDPHDGSAKCILNYHWRTVGALPDVNN